MKLFVWALAPFSKKSLAAGYERGVVFDQVDIPPYDTEQMEQLRRDHHPLATIPLLQRDDGSYLIDSGVIAEYFDLIGTAGAPLLPRDPEANLEMRALERFAELIFTPTVYLTWAYHVKKKNDDRTVKNFQQLNKAASMLNEHLVGRAFLCGDTYTLADIANASAIATAVGDKSLDLAPYPELARWFNKVQARPAWQRVAEDSARLPMPY